MKPIVYVLQEHNIKTNAYNFIAVYEKEVDALMEEQKCDENNLNADIEYLTEEAVLQ